MSTTTVNAPQAPAKHSLGPLAIFTAEKSFSHPWVGNAVANRLGLHVGRILLADLLDRVRWARFKPLPQDQAWIDQLRRDGVVAIPDFLPPAEFERLQKEVIGTIKHSLAERPPRDNPQAGFGKKESFDYGFDRFDGPTLNRFIDLSDERTPATLALIRSERFQRLYRAAQGRTFPEKAVSLYYTRFGPEGIHDLQKDFHRDTFHFTVKLWYYVAPVPAGEGPFIYVRGSNRSAAPRLGWEYRRSVDASAGKKGQGSFRITEDELRELGYPEPETFAVPANTMVIGDTHGFHRRGDAPEGAERFAIYAGMRRSPYRL